MGTIRTTLLRSTNTVALAAALAFSIASPALAQRSTPDEGAGETGNPSDEIVVTATRQDEKLSKVPVSVAAFTAETMDRQGVRNINDIARITPGLNFSKDTFGSGTSTNISIRGISSGSGAATTGIYVDDVAIQIRSNAQTAFGTAFPRVFDLDRIEVLRGPQGTLFGAGAQGGVVRFITPKPSLDGTELYGRAELALTRSGDPSYEGGLAAGFAIVPDKIGVRASAYYRKDGGWVDRRPFNVATPGSTEFYENANGSDTLALRGAATFQLGETVTLTPSLYYQRVRNDDTGTLWGNLTDSWKGRFVNGYSLAQTANDRFMLPSLNISVDLGSVELAAVTAYFDRKGASVQDYTNLNTNFIFETPYPFVPGWKAPGLATARQKVFSQEVRLSSTDRDAPVRWTVGAYYSRARQIESFKIEDQTTARIIPLEAIFGIGLTDGKYIFTSANDTVDKQWAVFAQFDAHPAPGLTATLGLRYSGTTFDYRRDLGGPLNYAGSGPETVTTTGVQKAKPFTPKFGLSYEIDDGNMLYASAAKGFRVGGVNPPLFASCQVKNYPSTFGPDTTWSFEAGTKNRLFGGALRTEASVFHIRWNNIQQFILAGCAGNGFRDNIGGARSQGFDLQFTLRASSALQLSGSVGYVDAKYNKTVISDGVTFARKGDSLPGSPWQFTGNVDYTAGLSDSTKGYLHADMRYNSRNNGKLASYDDPTASGYDPNLQFDPAITEVNARIGLRTGPVDASIFVNNLFDTAPLLGKSHDTAASPLYYYGTVRPRTVGLTVTFRN
ncbi:TonB-dependent receptor [Novosphingobium taihuense]|uniref:Outer membrane receptor protein involved in Fe transport n=1 Tax=Novosphingobium taihuense TaxID=260085 RepID=A0A7W7ABW3_9SPHN|nr:TonB-dependent receptor [Novosphingobium taihuense]MBB4614185.1 outer membrane receptor protein involved in Fe transport [Novosphingobium taihuense]TWH87034.1 outer membrane receptor protein involved in Fe transport [Novosphingobium taihuense]